MMKNNIQLTKCQNLIKHLNNYLKHHKISINHSDVPVRLLNDNCTSLYNQYSLKFPAQEVSYSTFKRCMPKNFKKSKKETDLCGHCENGKAAIIQYSKINNELKELKLSKVSKKEISKKQKELDKVCDKKKGI